MLARAHRLTSVGRKHIQVSVYAMCMCTTLAESRASSTLKSSSARAPHVFAALQCCRGGVLVLVRAVPLPEVVRLPPNAVPGQPMRVENPQTPGTYMTVQVRCPCSGGGQFWFPRMALPFCSVLKRSLDQGGRGCEAILVACSDAVAARKGDAPKTLQHFSNITPRSSFGEVATRGQIRPHFGD